MHVRKSGVFSAFGDNHEISAPIASGAVDDGQKRFVDLKIDARTLVLVTSDKLLLRDRAMRGRVITPQALLSAA